MGISRHDVSLSEGQGCLLIPRHLIELLPVPLFFFLSVAVLLPLGVRDTRNFKTISGATVDRGRTESTDRCEIVDVQSRTKKMISDMKHDHFADKQRIGAERLRFEQLALEAGL